MIKGLTDPESVQPRLPQLGKLRKGAPKPENGNKPGAELPHFRFATSDNAVMRAFVGAFGANPDALDVYIPRREPEHAFQTCCEIWDASGLVHRCDGETMSIWREGARYERGERACDPAAHQDGDPRKDSIGRLDVILPDLIRAGFVGYVTLETHSINDLAHIMGVLVEVYDSAGDLRGIRFRIWRELESIGVPGWGDRKGKRARADKWLVKIRPVADWAAVSLAMAEQRALALTAPTQPIPAGWTVESDTPGVVEVIEPELVDDSPPDTPPAPNPFPATLTDFAVAAHDAWPDVYPNESAVKLALKDADYATWGAAKKDSEAAWRALAEFAASLPRPVAAEPRPVDAAR